MALYIWADAGKKDMETSVSFPGSSNGISQIAAAGATYLEFTKENVPDALPRTAGSRLLPA
jgi:hypothetical protein